MTIKELYEIAKEKNMEDYTLGVHYECNDDYYSILDEEVKLVEFNHKTKQANVSVDDLY